MSTVDDPSRFLAALEERLTTLLTELRFIAATIKYLVELAQRGGSAALAS